MNAIGKFGCMVATVYLSLCSTIFAQNPQQVVKIPDQNLRSAIRRNSRSRTINPSPQARMRSLTRLNAGRKGIEDLTGLEHATNLTYLQLPNNEFSSLEPLMDLTKVETLYIYAIPTLRTLLRLETWSTSHV